MADSPRTPAEHAEIIQHAIQHGWAYRPESEYHRRTGASLAALVALADRYRERWLANAEGFSEQAGIKEEAFTERDRLRATVERLADIHHRTLTGSRLHDPENIDSFRDCLCKTCKEVTDVLAGGAGDE